MRKIKAVRVLNFREFHQRLTKPDTVKPSACFEIWFLIKWKTRNNKIIKVFAVKFVEFYASEWKRNRIISANKQEELSVIF